MTPPQKLPTVPTELISEIGVHLSSRDLQTLRYTSKRFRYGVKTIFGKELVNAQTVFPTYVSVASFLALLRCESFFPGMVDTVTLVGEAPRIHEHGSDWAWERLEDSERAVVTPGDRMLQRGINAAHAAWCSVNDDFCYSGGYRILLSKSSSPLTHWIAKGKKKTDSKKQQQQP